MRSSPTLRPAVFCLDWERWKRWCSQTPLLLHVKSFTLSRGAKLTAIWMAGYCTAAKNLTFDLFILAIKCHFK